MMASPGQAAPSVHLDDDQLGRAAVSIVVSELEWTPDVAPAVIDRIARDAVAYPDQFDRRARPQGDRTTGAGASASTGRTISRIVVIAIVSVLVAGLVVVAATADVAGAATVLGAAVVPGAT
jgi:hypothetical protein